MYSSEVFSIINQLKPSKRGELEITDVNSMFIKRRKMLYEIIRKYWGDAGESIDSYHDVIDHIRKKKTKYTLQKLHQKLLHIIYLH